MDEWVLWVILAVVLGVAEIFTVTAVLGLFGVAALITAGVAVALPLPFQLLVFAASSVAGLLFVRPIARRHLLQPRLERFGIDALVGSAAYVVQDVTGAGGRVRIDGDEWTARSFDDSVVIPEGTTVDVLDIRGSTAYVYPRE